MAKSDKKKKALSDEEIDKAFEEFEEGLDDDEEFEEGLDDDEDVDLSKAEDDDRDESGYDDDDDDMKDEKKKKKAKAKKAKKEKKMKKAQQKEMEKANRDTISKGIEVSPFLKAFAQESERAQKKQAKKLKKALNQVSEVLKGLTDAILENNEAEEKTPARQPKSRVQKGHIVDKFAKGVDSGALFEDDDEVKTVGVISGGRKILATMNDMAFDDSKGVIKDENFAKAITTFEATHSMTPSIKKAVEEHGKFKIDFEK